MLSSVRGKRLDWTETRNNSHFRFAFGAAHRRHGLDHSGVPVLTLLQAVEAAGWAPAARRVRRTRGGDRAYQSRGIAGKPEYLRCPLTSEAIFGAGQIAFWSLEKLQI